MKIRNVKITADLKGCKAEFRPLFEASISDMVKVLESHHWDEAWDKVTARYAVRLEGELTSRIKKMSNKDLALMIFNKVETDSSGAVWFCITDYDIDTYFTAKSVIGYGLASDDITRVNTRYLEGRSTTSLSDKRNTAANLVHEKFHDRGASHDSASTARRPNSSAYLSGTVFEIAYNTVFKERLADIGVIMPEIKPVETKPVEALPVDPVDEVKETVNPKPVHPTPAPDVVPTVPDEKVTPVTIINRDPVTGSWVCRWTFIRKFPFIGKVCSFEKNI